MTTKYTGNYIIALWEKCSYYYVIKI